jgi:hypothetical protein
MKDKVQFAPLLEKVNGYVFLLRRHSELRYQSDLREYNVKRMVVTDGIVEALGELTKVSLPVIYEDIPVEDLREVSIASIHRLMRQTVRNMKLSLRSYNSSSLNANGYSHSIQRWENALRVFSESAAYTDERRKSSESAFSS